MSGIAARLARHAGLRYLVVSVMALGADMAMFLGFLRGGMGPTLASALAYGLGVAVHWWGSSRAVFAGQLAAPGAERARQQALFVGSALVGLAITTGIVGLGSGAGLDPRLAKLVAVAASFIATWILRRHFVFGGTAPATA